MWLRRWTAVLKPKSFYTRIALVANVRDVWMVNGCWRCEYCLSLCNVLHSMWRQWVLQPTHPIIHPPPFCTALGRDFIGNCQRHSCEAEDTLTTTIPPEVTSTALGRDFIGNYQRHSCEAKDTLTTTIPPEVTSSVPDDKKGADHTKSGEVRHDLCIVGLTFLVIIIALLQILYKQRRRRLSSPHTTSDGKTGSSRTAVDVENPRGFGTPRLQAAVLTPAF